MIGNLEGKERGIAGIARGNREAPEPGEGALGIASIEKTGTARVGVVAGSYLRRTRKARDTTTAEAACCACGWQVASRLSKS